MTSSRRTSVSHRTLALATGLMVAAFSAPLALAASAPAVYHIPDSKGVMHDVVDKGQAPADFHGKTSDDYNMSGYTFSSEQVAEYEKVNHQEYVNNIASAMSSSTINASTPVQQADGSFALPPLPASEHYNTNYDLGTKYGNSPGVISTALKLYNPALTPGNMTQAGYFDLVASAVQTSFNTYGDTSHVVLPTAATMGFAAPGTGPLGDGVQPTHALNAPLHSSTGATTLLTASTDTPVSASPVLPCTPQAAALGKETVVNGVPSGVLDYLKEYQSGATNVRPGDANNNFSGGKPGEKGFQYNLPNGGTGVISKDAHGSQYYLAHPGEGSGTGISDAQWCAQNKGALDAAAAAYADPSYTRNQAMIAAQTKLDLARGIGAGITLPSGQGAHAPVPGFHYDAQGEPVPDHGWTKAMLDQVSSLETEVYNLENQSATATAAAPAAPAALAPVQSAAPATAASTAGHTVAVFGSDAAGRTFLTADHSVWLGGPEAGTLTKPARSSGVAYEGASSVKTLQVATGVSAKQAPVTAVVVARGVAVLARGRSAEAAAKAASSLLTALPTASATSAPHAAALHPRALPAVVAQTLHAPALAQARDHAAKVRSTELAALRAARARLMAPAQAAAPVAPVAPRPAPARIAPAPHSAPIAPQPLAPQPVAPQPVQPAAPAPAMLPTATAPYDAALLGFELAAANPQ